MLIKVLKILYYIWWYDCWYNNKNVNNKNCHAIVTELFIRIRKLKIYLVFISQSYFAVPESIRPN